MEKLFDWCNDNQGVLAAVAILIVVIPAAIKLIPKCVKHIQKKRKAKKEASHRAELTAITDYLRSNTVATTKKLTKALNRSPETVQQLLSELIEQGIVVAACDNCTLSNPNSIWELSK